MLITFTNLSLIVVDIDIKSNYLTLKFTASPLGCLTRQGPFTDHCLIGIWRRVGCSDTGRLYPSRLTFSQRSTWNRMSIRYSIT